MNRLTRGHFLAVAGAGAVCSPALGNVEWPAAKPEDLGFDTSKLDAFQKNLAARNTDALLIVKNGTVAAEWYAPGKTAASRHSMASAAKALVGGTSLLLAMSDGRIWPNDLASKFIEAWRGDPRRSKITIRHLATHTSGLEDSSVPGVAHPNEPGWKGKFWSRDPDPFSISLKAPLLFDSGSGYQYSNPGMAALAYAVTASLRGAPESNIQTLLRERVMTPLGIPDDSWSIGYGQAYKVDGLELYANWGGSNFTPRASARIGEWMMKHGEWNGTQLASRASVAQLLKYAGMRLPDRSADPYAAASALCWYTNFDGVWPAVPRDAFAAAGAGHEIVLVVPSLRLIVVRTGKELAPRDKEAFWPPAYKEIFEPVMAALGYPAKPVEVPYSRSEVIRGVEFAPANTISRQAIDSDNWPMTWADDGDLYTSYGDGSGFDPKTPEKLGMGFARIQGPASGFRGINIRTETGERVGDGPKSPKASGLLMEDGVLYMWVRNVKNSQLVWSVDRAKTWIWDFKIEAGFGSPSFLNYGPNYAGAQDDYVYAYSQQGPSAYEIDDGVVLGRVLKHVIRDREHWEFYAGVDKTRKAAWKRESAAALPVLRFPKHCQRVDAAYHAATKRYLLAVGYGHNGGWGIFDAPAPWGPWTVVYHTEYWGLGETHGYRFSPKWISEDGHSMALVFSGLMYDGVSYDAFCVRGMKLDF